MSQTTNVLHLPDPIGLALEKFRRHEPSGADYSSSALTTPARIRQLMSRHASEIVEDVSTKAWAIYSQALHKLLEEAAASEVAEETLFGSISGYTIVCRLDHAVYRKGLLSDYKLAKAYSYVKGGRDEWTAQMNIQAEILEQNGIQPHELEVVMFVRDWNRWEAKTREDYPQTEIVRLPIEFWGRDIRRKYIDQRIAIHEHASYVKDEDDLPVCTAEERWAQPDQWQVVKKSGKPGKGGFKRAVKGGNRESEADAIAFAAELNNQKKTQEHIVQLRPGGSPRCRICPVWEWCKPGQKFAPESEREV